MVYLAGLNVVLISRTEAKLQAAAEEVAARYKVQTKHVVADFAKANYETWHNIKTTISPLQVGLLVNNVGLSYDHAEWFDNISETLIRELVEVNIMAATMVSDSKPLFPPIGMSLEDIGQGEWPQHWSNCSSTK
jgi:17beta-estradiol 17-dehydrogenase / very-long-chain 3-oxoacyl-CoA reductase